MSFAIWDHTHPTQVNMPRLNPSQRFTHPRGMEGWVDLWPVTYRDGLPAHRRSSI